MNVAHRCQATDGGGIAEFFFFFFNGSIHRRRLNYSLCCGNQVPSASASYYHRRLSFSFSESSFISPRFSSSPAAHLIFNWGAQLRIFKHARQLFHLGTKRVEKWPFCLGNVKIITLLCFFSNETNFSLAFSFFLADSLVVLSCYFSKEGV